MTNIDVHVIMEWGGWNKTFFAHVHMCYFYWKIVQSIIAW